MSLMRGCVHIAPYLLSQAAHYLDDYIWQRLPRLFDQDGWVFHSGQTLVLHRLGVCLQRSSLIKKWRGSDKKGSGLRPLLTQHDNTQSMTIPGNGTIIACH